VLLHTPGPKEEIVPLEKRDLYRLPWSKNDNPIAWLEVTDICNLHCEGCYRQRMTGHKPVEEIREEIRFFQRWRNPDNVSIAGGEPLLHPEIVDIVALIAESGIKPILLTNASRLTPELLRELKKAGLAGFTIHIDSHQNRPGWEDKNEAEHNALRQQYADMIAAVGGLTTIFNSTVYPATRSAIPEVVQWAQANIDRVQGLVFITYRTFETTTTEALDSSGQAIDATRLSYGSEHFDEQFVSSPEVVELIQTACPAYTPAGYLGGTLRVDSYKWVAGVTLCGRDEVYGCIGKTTLELAEVAHHLFRGTYLAYLSQPRVTPFTFALSPWDKTLRRAARRWWGDVLRHPGRLFQPLRLQTIGIIQAPDVQPNGQADMCDSCPDMTVWNGNLVNSCRMDEYRLFGDLISVVNREKEV
jgi:organic radical activating enzyme